MTKSRGILERHGMKSTPEYSCWKHMKRRCYNSKNPDWHRYGGRGIEVCPEWRKSFKAFFLYMGHRPSPGHSLDRYPNNDGNYEPGNVRWATTREQARNTSRNRHVIIDGQRHCIATGAELLGIKADCLKQRLRRGTSLKYDPSVCKRGHALVGDNLYVMPETSPQAGCRVCRACKKEGMQRFLARRGTKSFSCTGTKWLRGS